MERRGKEGIATVWDVASRSVVSQLKAHRQWVNELAFARNGQMVATSAMTAQPFFGTYAPGNPRSCCRWRLGVSSVDISPDSAFMVAASTGAIRRWRLDLSGGDADPEQVLNEAQRTAGQVLDGVRLEVATPP